MKKLAIFIFAIALSGTMAFAQKQCKACDCTFLPEAGDWSLEMQFNPLGVNFNTFQLNGATIQGRYFFNEKSALRFNLGLSVNSQKDGYTGAIPNEKDFATKIAYDQAMAVYGLEYKSFEKEANGDLIVAAGYERHFPVAKRLDAYVGGQLGFDWCWGNAYGIQYKYDEFTSPESATFKNTWKNEYKENGKNASFAFILGAAAGFDFYVYKGLFLGAELNLRMNCAKALGGKVTQSTTNPTVKAEDQKRVDKTVNRDGSFSVSCYAIPSLRIGWKF